MNSLNLSIQPKRMSSREIALLTKKRHDNVMVDIDKILRVLWPSGDAPDFSGSYKTTKGNVYREYLLPERETLILVSGYDISMRAAIIDRWSELEGRNIITDEVELIERSLNLIKDQRLKIEEQDAKIALDAPKVDFVDKYMDSTGLRGLQAAAKSLRFKPRRFTDALKTDKFLYYAGESLVPIQKWLDSGIFQVIEGEGNGHAYNQTKITPKGMQYFAQRYATELLEE